MRKSIYTVEQIDALLSAKGMVIQGAYASVSDVAAPVEGGHYYIGAEAFYNIYTYINGAWVNAGPVGGQKGDTGEKGEKGDPFTYEDFTEEQLDDLERGAKAAQAAAEQAATSAESAAQTAAQEAAVAAAEIAAQAAAKNAVEDVGVEMAGYVSAAEAAQAAAEAARDSARDIVGGDYATKGEAQGYASTAETNAKSYTDQKVASIPVPDVSGQIGEHNSSDTAHSDIRTAVDGKLSKTGDTMTGNLTVPQLNLVPGNGGNSQFIPYANRFFIRTYTSDGQNRRDLVLWSREGAGNVTSALQLLDVASGTTTTHNILHEGNSNMTQLVSADTTPTVNGRINWTYK